MKKLAVIILNWNGRKLLEQFMPAAVADSITADSDLIVADNASSDDSVAFLREKYPQVRVLQFEKNLGFAAGYNRAIAETGYEYTLLLNSDVEVTPGWTLPLLRFMESHPDAAACQPKIRSYREPEKFEYAGAAGGYLDCNGYPYCRGRLFESIETDKGQYDGNPAQVSWASGAALMVRTADYLAAGGLDASFFAHMEEIDLCCRMQARGKSVWCVPGSVVYHVGGASLDASNPQKTYLNFRNNLLLLHKNSPAKEGKPRLFKRRLLDTLAFGMFVAKFRFRHANAILRAHRDFRRMKKNYKNLPATDFLPTLPGAKRNILVDHYLKRQKK